MSDANLFPDLPSRSRGTIGTAHTPTRATGSEPTFLNGLQPEDHPVHGWYRFVLSYPPHLIRRYEDAFGLTSRDRLLDPFCGTGTTLVEAKKRRLPSLGCDAHPFAALVSRVKTNWSLDAPRLRALRATLIDTARDVLQSDGLARLESVAGVDEESLIAIGSAGLDEDELKLLPTGFLSLRPLRRLLHLRAAIEQTVPGSPSAEREFFLVAFAHVIANGAGNFRFGPEIYRTRAKPDYDVLGHFERQSGGMIDELESMQRAGLADVPCTPLVADARSLEGVADDLTAVITSPPYPNEKDYTRTTRVEAILLRLVTDRPGLRRTKEGLLRSNTRNVFVDDADGDEVASFGSIRKICEEIEVRRIELGKTSGFEKLYHKVVAHYFGGMRRHFRALRTRLRPGAKLGYVVGDQFSFLMVFIPTARLLGEVAVAEGYRIDGIDLWRERFGSKVRNDREGRASVRIREEVLRLTRL